MKNKIFILIFCLTAFIVSSQSSYNKYSALETEFFVGKLIEHDKLLKNAIDGNPFGFFITYNTINSKKNNFNTLYNFPKRGYTFLYENFNSTVLGKAIAGFRHFSYNLKPNNKNPLEFTTAFGLGYASKSYNKHTNPQNYAHGSKLLASAFLKLQYTQLLLKNRLQLSTGVSLIHFSNISFKNPNLGLNTVSATIGINYLLKNVTVEKSTNINATKNIKYPINYNLILRGGYNESKIINSGLHPFYTFTFYGSKTLNNYSTITAGFDFFNSTFVKQYIKTINSEQNKNYNPNNYQRVGIFIGHELTQNHYAFISQIGYTIYYPFSYVSRIYERFGFKYKLSKHWFSELTIKVNLFRAEALEFGIGYKI